MGGRGQGKGGKRVYHAIAQPVVWLEQHFGAEMTRLSGPERSAMVSYTEQGHRKINIALRNEQISPHHRVLISDLDRVLARSRIPENIIVYRGVAHRGLVQQFVPGAVLEDRGFLSVSLRRFNAVPFMSSGTDSPEERAILKINIPKGTHGIGVSVKTLRIVGEEHELILPRSTRLRITGLEQREDAVYIEATVISQGRG